MTHKMVTTQFLVANSLKKFRDKIFTKIDSKEYTYNDVLITSNRVANGIQSLGYGPGDRIGLAIPNSFDLVCCLYGILKAGTTFVGINMMLGENDIRFILNDASIKMLITDKAGEEKILKMKGQLPNLKTIICLGGTTTKDVIAWDELLSKQPATDPLLTAKPEDDAFVVYTGGTTGTPKGVIHSQSSFYFAMISYSTTFNFVPTDNILLVTPLTHGAGLIMLQGSINGIRFIIEKKFDLFAVLDIIAREKVTAVALVPTIVYILLDILKQGKYDLSSLRILIYMTAPMSEARLGEAIDRFGPILIQTYGQTECPQIVTSLTQDDHIRAIKDKHLLASCGRPCQMMSLRIVDEKGNDVPQGETGEIIVCAPGVMKGYLNQPELTKATIVDGWLHTGDMGMVDKEGYVYIVDRKKDMIISGGMNVFCGTVENVLSKHPKVKQVAVIGIPDDKWGEAVIAIVVPDGDVTEEEILSFSKSKLNKYEQPKKIVFQQQMPLTAVAKIDKNALRAPYWQGKSRRVN